ncbi:hypothetical protein D3C77_234900 [compost metagenome]
MIRFTCDRQSFSRCPAFKAAKCLILEGNGSKVLCWRSWWFRVAAAGCRLLDDQYVPDVEWDSRTSIVRFNAQGLIFAGIHGKIFGQYYGASSCKIGTAHIAITANRLQVELCTAWYIFIHINIHRHRYRVSVAVDQAEIGEFEISSIPVI